jgi:hypothetical protein
MPTQLVNTRGHYPAGYPRVAGQWGAPSYDPAAMERATDTPDLQVFKTAVQEAQSTSVASDYFSRNACARDWWYARWPNQTIDGRKWGDRARACQPWPWPGAADTRLRMVERVIGEHRTLMTFALRNMKWQAKSTRPGGDNSGLAKGDHVVQLDVVLAYAIGAASGDAAGYLVAERLRRVAARCAMETDRAAWITSM